MLRGVPTVVAIDSPAYIVGDINRNVFDLESCATFSTTRHILLGNCFDRGALSVPCLALLLVMLQLSLQDVALLREFRAAADESASDEERKQEYRAVITLCGQFQQVFAHLPLGCLVDRRILCMHGTVGGNVRHVAQIAAWASSAVHVRGRGGGHGGPRARRLGAVFAVLGG